MHQLIKMKLVTRQY